MFIHSLTIENFRNFGKSEIFFNEGTNVIIGPNNAGKTNVFKALGLIFDPNSNRKLDVDDFYKGIDTKEYFGFNKTTGKLIKQSPPNIIISATIVESTGENKDKELLHDDKNTVYDWLVQMEPFYQAKLTYKFFLPDDENCKKYEDAVLDLIKKGKTSADDYWRMVKRKFIRKFVVRIYGGFAEQEKRADTDSLNRFDFQFLNALRDAERHLFTGQNTLLKEVLNYFLDDDLKNSQNLNEEEKLQKIDERNEDFSDRAVAFINLVKERINEEPILKYSRDVGASLGGEPTFQGETTEVELFSALKLIVQNHLLGINLPATHNGLGYSNLIFISILLAKMQMSASNYGNEDEKKVFPMLLIEEPEAHLHPAMQFKLLKFLKEKVKENTQVRQVFVTTHSTQITSAVDLDEIICLNQAEKGKVKIAYPGKVFRSDCEEDQKSKAYVKRFLDATNSDMLFAKSVIFVEGITEQLLFSLLAEYKNISLARLYPSCCITKHLGELLQHDAARFSSVGAEP